MYSTLAIGTFLVVVSMVHADDRPYGSETLTYMLRQAHIVVRVQKAEQLYKKKGPSVIGYKVTFGSVLHGNKSLTEATVEFPASELPKVEDFQEAILFIAKSDFCFM